jgi:single-stranded-DNA-specific exonuclease
MAEQRAQADAAEDDASTVPGGARPPAPWGEQTVRWRVRERLSEDVLDGVAGVPRLAVQLLHNRGVRVPEDAGRFLAGTWRRAGSGLPELDSAVGRILDARERGEHVVVWGDYDCDGMTSCALLVDALLRVGVRAEPYAASREDDGRGLNLEKLPELAADGTRLIITTDCGIDNVAEVAAAAELGMDVIVTDHHPPHGPLARAYALINPHLAREDGADAAAAGVAVAFRLAEAVFARAAVADAEAALDGLLDLVAIGTIADVVPLTQGNWALARAGLKRLNAAPRPGVRALLDLAGHAPGAVTARDVAFSVAPRLNAGGRLGMPLLSIRLLLAPDAMSAAVLAGELEVLQQERQRLTEQVYAQAREAALAAPEGAASPLIAVGEGWPLGILGLAASRLVDEFHRPAIVISRDAGSGLCRGSARGPAGVNLGVALAEVAPLFRRFGGHAQAAGFTLAKADLPELLAHLRSRAWTVKRDDAEAEPAMGGAGGAQGGEGEPAHQIDIDCQLPLRRLVADIFEAVSSLEPYGTSFSEPVFVSSPVRITSCWRSGAGGKTLRLRLRQEGVERVAFWPRRGELCEAFVAALPTLPPVSVVYTLAPTRDGRDFQPKVMALDFAR